MPHFVWFFMPGAVAVVFSIYQAAVVIFPNGLRLAKLLKEQRPTRLKSLMLNDDDLVMMNPSVMFAKTIWRINYYFNDVDYDLPKAGDYKVAIRNGIIRLAASLVVVIASMGACVAAMFIAP